MRGSIQTSFTLALLQGRIFDSSIKQQSAWWRGTHSPDLLLCFLEACLQCLLILKKISQPPDKNQWHDHLKPPMNWSFFTGLITHNARQEQHAAAALDCTVNKSSCKLLLVVLKIYSCSPGPQFCTVSWSYSTLINFIISSIILFLIERCF